MLTILRVTAVILILLLPRAVLGQQRTKVVRKVRAGKQQSRIIDARFPTTHLLGTWAHDLDYPQADFILDKDQFFVGSDHGSGASRYLSKQDSLILYFPEGVSRNLILRASGDSLIIAFDDGIVRRYVRWTR